MSLKSIKCMDVELVIFQLWLVVYYMVLELTVLEAEHFAEHLASRGGKVRYNSFNLGNGAALHRASKLGG